MFMIIQNEINNEFYVIARNSNQLLVTPESSIKIDDIYSFAHLITLDGSIIEKNVLIGTITKFGYWERINLKYNDYIKTLKQELKLNDMIIGLAVSNFVNYKLNENNLQSHLKYEANIRNILFALNELKKNKESNLFISNFNFLTNYDDDNIVSFLVIYLFFENTLEIESHSICQYLDSIFDSNKSLLFQCFLMLILEINKSNNVDIALESLTKLINEKQIDDKIKTEIITTIDNIVKTNCCIIMDSIFSKFYQFVWCLKKGITYNDTILLSKKNNNDMICTIGIASGLLYGEEMISDDWKIELLEEEELKNKIKELLY